MHQQHSPASRLPRLPPRPSYSTPRSARLIGASGRSRPLSACQSARPGLRGSAAPALSARQSSLCPFRPHRRSTPCAFDLFSLASLTLPSPTHSLTHSCASSTLSPSATQSSAEWVHLLVCRTSQRRSQLADRDVAQRAQLQAAGAGTGAASVAVAGPGRGPGTGPAAGSGPGARAVRLGSDRTAPLLHHHAHLLRERRPAYRCVTLLRVACCCARRVLIWCCACVCMCVSFTEQGMPTPPLWRMRYPDLTLWTGKTCFH